MIIGACTASPNLIRSGLRRDTADPHLRLTCFARITSEQIAEVRLRAVLCKGFEGMKAQTVCEAPEPHPPG